MKSSIDNRMNVNLKIGEIYPFSHPLKELLQRSRGDDFAQVVSSLSSPPPFPAPALAPLRLTALFALTRITYFSAACKQNGSWSEHRGRQQHRALYGAHDEMGRAHRQARVRD